MRMASSKACRNRLRASFGSRPCFQRSTIPRPHAGHRMLACSLTATVRHRAPSLTWWYPIDIGGGSYSRCLMYGTTSLQHPFAGLGAGAAARGRYDVFGCICTAGRLGGGFGCPVIESFAMVAEATAFVIGAAAEFTGLGGGGLIQPAWAGWLILIAGRFGNGASSSLSHKY